MTEKTCSTCQCNKVCDHNKYGFENCGNYISADVAPRAEVAREIFEEIEKALDALDHRHMLCGNPKQSWGVRSAMTEIAEIKKKYTED